MRLNPLLISFLFVFSFAVIPFSAKATILSKQISEATFKDQNENDVSISDLKGEVWIANFIFTRCQGMCPLMSGRMALLQEKLSGSGIKLISFSVDPEYDNPEILKEYAKRFKAGDHWLFLTGGTKAQVWDFIGKDFQLGVAEPSEEDLKNGAEPVLHSNRFVLVDRLNQVRGYYDTSESAQLKKIESDALKLLKVLD
jgi:protein SCO1/2